MLYLSVGQKLDQKIPVVPFVPVFKEPFSSVIVDCVGPLPKTRSGSLYLLTTRIMCASTQFLEAFSLRNISKTLIKFLYFDGLLKEIQSDQGSNITLVLFEVVVYQLSI